MNKLARKSADQSAPQSSYRKEEKNRGRKESRLVEVFPVVEQLPDYPSVKQIIRVIRCREIKGKKQSSVHYYVSSLTNKDALYYFNAIRDHWKIENSLHWVRDVVLKEDTTKFHCYSTLKKNALYRSVIFNLFKTRFGGSITHAMELVANRPLELWKTLRT